MSWRMALVCLLILPLGQGCSSKADLVGEVIGISDGDSLRVLDAKRSVYKIRLAYIDAPEKGMPFAAAAKKALSDKVYRRQVHVHIVETDRYGRSVGLVKLGQQDVNYLQLSEGWAWHYRHYAKKSQNPDAYQRYAAAEEKARSALYGLWQGRDIEAPWDWRENRRNSKQNSPVDDSDRRAVGYAN